MYVLNGNQKKILKALRICGLTEYESKTYFTLLLTGKSRVLELSRRCAVPQSKIYWTLLDLEEKGLVYSVDWKPKLVGARDLDKYVSEVIRKKKREIRLMGTARDKIMKVVSALKPIEEKFGGYIVFEPNRSKERVQVRK